ncbi:MAG TPA: divalent metal cation transporter [Candidatus Saccharimonadales bacterium]
MRRDKNLIEKVAELPADLLDETVAKTSKFAQAIPRAQTIEQNAKDDIKKAEKKTKEYWNVLGPGLTTGASDDDPSGIATYSQAGAQYGFQLLWLSPFTFPLMSLVQEMCARIGIVTGRGLAANIRAHFSRRVLYLCTLLLFAANAFNIGADLGAMAKAVQLLNGGVNFYLAVLGFAVLSLLLQIYLPYARYARYLKWLALVLLAYVASALLANLDWGNVLRQGFTPSIEFSRDQIILICAILGTTISPYLFFWQTSQEVETQIEEGKKTLASRQGSNHREIKEMRVDVWSGMFLSNLVMFFIIAASGAILFPQGLTEIQSAAQAAEALRPFAGDATFWLFALGIIGTGMLAIPVLAGASSYAVSESLGWKEGLNKKLRQAHAFYGVLMISVLIGLAINFLGIDPIKALIYAAVANGIVAPLILALIVIISSNKRIMGEWANRPLTNLLGWSVTSLMVLAGGAAILVLFG